MKKLFFSLGLIVATTIIALPSFAEGTENLLIPLTLECSHIDIRKDHPRTPVQNPRVEQNEYTLYFPDEIDFFVNLYVVDEENELMLEYTIFVSAETDSITLPFNLQGIYVIEVIRGEQHFWGEIELD